jgi:hypothetical protein
VLLKATNRPNQKGTFKVNDIRAAQRVVVTPDGDGVVSHVGSLLVAELADRLGFTEALSAGMAETVVRSRRHDPGCILTHLAVTLVDGGDCLSDLRVLRNQPELFGEVASHPTAWRAVSSGYAAEAITAACRDARATAWAAGMAPESVTLDVDSTLLTAHSDKEDAAPTYKGGYGHHPILVYLDETEEALAGSLRPGNAGANNAADHICVLDAAIAQLPKEWRGGHEEGSAPEEVVHPILVRADSAGASHDFVDACAQRHCEVSIGFAIDDRVREALLLAQEEDWVPAVECDGSRREGAWVTELTGLIDLDAWGEEVRLIARREHPHPGAQLSLFDTLNEFRHQCFITTSHGAAEDLELRHRGHARVEDRIRAAKDMGMENLPFRDVCPNENWLALVLAAQDLLAWTKGICLDDELISAEPKRLRYALFHVAARLARSGRQVRVRIQATWPWADSLARAFARLRRLSTA